MAVDTELLKWSLDMAMKFWMESGVGETSRDIQKTAKEFYGFVLTGEVTRYSGKEKEAE